MALITSSRNPAVKYVRSLERARLRQADGVYLVEGVRLVHEALTSGQRATLALYDPALLSRSTVGSSLLERLPRWADRAHEVDGRLLRAAGQTETPSGVVAVLRSPEREPLETHARDQFGVILDRVADPGNAGTILRTADAAGAGYVVTLPGSVDLFSPKVVRAGMGAHFRLPLYSGVSWNEVSTALREASLVALDAHAATSIYEFQWPQRTGLIVGSEAHGLSRQAEPHLHHRVRIPMKPGVESLNAAVAASIVIYSALGASLLSDA